MTPLGTGSVSIHSYVFSTPSAPRIETEDLEWGGWIAMVHPEKLPKWKTRRKSTSTFEGCVSERMRLVERPPLIG